MPRRGRKKSTVSCRKPKLHFTESPVQVEPHPVSPVLGADNPITAKCIPLEDCSDVSWISPNFKEIRNKLHLFGGRRNLRLRKTCKTTTQNLRPRRHCSKQDINSTTGKRTQNSRSKFKPLMFLQDTNNEEPESELHSISVNNSPEEMVPGNQSLEDNDVRRKTSKKRLIQGNDNFNGVSCNTPEKKLMPGNRRFNDVSLNTSEKRLMPGNKTFNGHSFNTPVMNKKQTPVLADEFNVSKQEYILEHHISVGNSPKTSTHSNDFDITLQGGNSNHLPCLCKSPKTKNRYSVTQMQALCPVHKPVSNRRRLTKTFSTNHQRSGILNSFSHSCSDSDTNESPRRSQRLREKYLEAIKLFQCPSPKNRNKDVKVLVEDTPESEYHIRLKRRQLRQLVTPL